MGIVYICRAASATVFWDGEHQRAKGPSAEVIEGRDPRRWVLKTFRPEVLTHAGGPERFERECLIWSTLLPHPNVVRAITVDHMGDRLYLWLEYVDGGDLGQRLRRGALDLAEALRIALQFCEGMQFLSGTYGIVHRDIKPQNVLIATDGTVKVTDFGLAQLSQASVATEAARQDGFLDTNMITMAGAIAGTLPYMSPEQLMGMPLATTSDVYAFGVMFYEMLSGRRPFGGATIDELRRQHVSYQPVPLHEYGDIPIAISDCIARCLAKRPQDRFGAFATLGERLESYCRANSLAHVIPNKPSLATLEESMGYHDWAGRAYSLAKIGDRWRHRPEKQRSYFERSHQFYQRALALEPKAPGANSNVGVSLHRLGRPSEALPYLEREVELHPNLPLTQQSLANVCLVLGQKERAFQVYERAASLAPNEISIWRQLAGFYSADGREADRARAMRQVQTTLSDMNESQAAINAIGTAIVCGDWGDVRSAIDLHRYSVERWPTIALAWFNFAVTLHRTAAFEQAKPLYDRALQLDPGLTSALLNRGLVFASAGAIDKACLDWRSAVSQQQGVPSDTAAGFIEIAKGPSAGTVAIARNVKALEPVLQYRMS
jgi:serine/threonine protein kinase